MSIPSLTLSLTVIEKQSLSVSSLYNEMIAMLNIKGRDLFSPSMADLYHQKHSLSDFIKQSPLIDPNITTKVLCQDAFEMCWTLAKAQYIYRAVKQNMKNNTLLNYDEMNRSRRDVSVPRSGSSSEQCLEER